MGKLKVVLNSAGVRGLLRSAEMKAVMEARAAEIKSRAGDGYEVYIAQTRAVAIVGAATNAAENDNFALDENAINNMELVDALAETEDDNPIAISRACLLLLGKDMRKNLYDHLRNDDGRVPVDAVSQELIEIFSAFGAKGKK